MALLGGRSLACALVACAACLVATGKAKGGADGMPVPSHLLVDQAATTSTAGSATYTPMQEAGVVNPLPPVPPPYTAPAAPAPMYAPLTPVAPSYAAPAPVAPAAAPVYTPPASVAPTYVPPASSSSPYVPMVSSSPPYTEPGATVFAKAARPVKPSRRVFGLATDVGMPDGLNLGLVVAPAEWLRLGASMGSNSASLDYRGGLTLIPAGWGPSFSVEVGHCNIADTTSIIRYFFKVAPWMQGYVQQLGYTYVNAHVGFDYRLANFTLFLHGGVTYLMGTVRATQPVVVDAKTNTTISIPGDGNIRVGTLSAKAGIVYMFGGL